MKFERCKICDREAESFGAALFLSKHHVQFYRCRHCGFVQTENPYWLEEAYANPVNANDVGMLQRTMYFSRLARILICLFLNGDGRFLDYGGGYGLFTRMARDLGYDFYRHDKYCQNLFARGFDGDVAGESRYEMITAFEVFEHMVDPLQEARHLRSLSDTILLSTTLLPDPAPAPGSWWYYGVEHGQHIAFHSLKSLCLLAEQLGLNLYSNGKSVHLLSSIRMPSYLFKYLCHPAVQRSIGLLCRREPLTAIDYESQTRTFK